MPRLSYPGGRKAAAFVKPEEPSDETLHEEVIQGEGLDQSASEQSAETDPSAALKAEVAALKKAKDDWAAQLETERLRADQLAKRDLEREAEIGRLQEQTVNSQTEAIEAALAAAQAEIDSAQHDMEQAVTIADAKGQTEAYMKLASATARKLSLEAGKEALERGAKERKVETRTAPPADPFEQAIANFPPLTQRWLRDHPMYIKEPRQTAKLNALHFDVVDEGYTPHTKGYIERMEELLGLRQTPVQEDVIDDNDPPPRRPMVSAPPSREVPSSSGTRSTDQVKLTAEMKEAAKIAGISEKEYAVQLQKLKKEKLNGNYGGAP